MGGVASDPVTSRMCSAAAAGTGVWERSGQVTSAGRGIGGGWDGHMTGRAEGTARCMESIMTHPLVQYRIVGDSWGLTLSYGEKGGSMLAAV